MDVSWHLRAQGRGAGRCPDRRPRRPQEGATKKVARPSRSCPNSGGRRALVHEGTAGIEGKSHASVPVAPTDETTGLTGAIQQRQGWTRKDRCGSSARRGTRGTRPRRSCYLLWSRNGNDLPRKKEGGSAVSALTEPPSPRRRKTVSRRFRRVPTGRTAVGTPGRCPGLTWGCPFGAPSPEGGALDALPSRIGAPRRGPKVAHAPRRGTLFAARRWHTRVGSNTPPGCTFQQARILGGVALLNCSNWNRPPTLHLEDYSRR